MIERSRFVVLTGGPCSGKTSVMKLLDEALGDEAIFVPEAWTQLIGEGYPLPDGSWTERDWYERQVLVIRRQLALEDEALRAAAQSATRHIICDRAPFDSVAYPEGARVVREVFGGRREAIRRYRTVIHLESLATARPAEYSLSSNGARYESLEEAQALELRAREAWRFHPCWHFLPGRHSVQELARLAARLISEPSDR